MDDKTIATAKAEARRFLAAAAALETELDHQKQEAASRSFPVYINAPKYSGALRRASMDLTRALADLRRP
jgi:uncharacterized protein YqfA (UPF0365 family)